MIKYIVCVLGLLIGFIVFLQLYIYIAYFIFGFFPFIRAKNLKQVDVDNVKKYGIAHKTTEEEKKE